MPRHVPLPRVWPVRAGDVVAVVVGNGALILGMWWRHGGLDDLHSPEALATAAGQVTALLGTYLALVQIVLVARSPWLDEPFGMHRLAIWHRRLGNACLWLITAHVVFSTIGWSLGDGSNVVTETFNLIGGYPYVLMAWAGFGLFVLVAVTSVRAARARLSYETWFFIHLYAYLAVALAFLHQLAIGTDFTNDPVADWYWIGLYVVCIALVVSFRVGRPMILTLRHQLRVAAVRPEADGVVSVYLTGRHLDRLPVRSGQYFLWHFLAGGGWWRAHPFSLSAAPNPDWLRITVKNLGDWTDLVQRLQPGTRVAIEGPYGAFTGTRRATDRILLIAGGIGITPLRALFESLPVRAGSLTLIYRAGSWADVVFRDELDALAKARRATVTYIVGHRDSFAGDPIGPDALATMVPDLVRRDVFICGSRGLIEHVRQSLGRLGVPARQIHDEDFSY
jgi:predicted ferric reductase